MRQDWTHSITQHSWGRDKGCSELCNVYWTTSWWRHQMETFSALLAICAGNSPVPGEFPAQRPVTRSFDVFFDLCLNKRLSKQSWGWWFETLSCPLWRHCNVSSGASFTLIWSWIANHTIVVYGMQWPIHAITSTAAYIHRRGSEGMDEKLHTADLCGCHYSLTPSTPGAWINIKMPSYQYRKSHCGDKTILRPSYLHNDISYTGKMPSLYWIRALVLVTCPFLTIDHLQHPAVDIIRK